LNTRAHLNNLNVLRRNRKFLVSVDSFADALMSLFMNAKINERFLLRLSVINYVNLQLNILLNNWISKIYIKEHVFESMMQFEERMTPSKKIGNAE